MSTDKSDLVTGAVQGLSSAAAAGFTVAMAFLGVWGWQGKGDWAAEHFFVLVPLFLAICLFASVPFTVSLGTKKKESVARGSYAFACGMLIAAVMIALGLAWFGPRSPSPDTLESQPCPCLCK